MHEIMVKQSIVILRVFCCHSPTQFAIKLRETSGYEIPPIVPPRAASLVEKPRRAWDQ